MFGIRVFLASTALSVAALSGAASAQSLGSNLIVNGDAEDGPYGSGNFVPPPGFTVTGELSQVGYDTGGGYPNRADAGGGDVGDAFFSGGNVALSTGLQVIDVSGLASFIDLGATSYVLSALLGGYSSQGDNAVLGITFNGLSGALGSASIGPVTAADRDNATALLFRSTQGFVPVGTRSIDVLLTMTRFAGSANDGYADNLSLVLNAEAAPGVPEPASWAMMIAGFGAAGVVLRRRTRTSVRYA